MPSQSTSVDERPKYAHGDQEIWRTIPKFEAYEVSDLGRIRRSGRPGRGVTIGKMVKTKPTKSGYLYIHLMISPGMRKTVQVHQAVAAAFCGGWPNDTVKITPAHWDGDKHNNRAENLRWTSRRDNYYDKLRHGRATHGERNGFAKLTDEQVTSLRADLTAGGKMKDLAVKYGVSADHIGRIARGVSRKVRSYYEPVALEDYLAARA